MAMFLALLEIFIHTIYVLEKIFGIWAPWHPLKYVSSEVNFQLFFTKHRVGVTENGDLYERPKIT